MQLVVGAKVCGSIVRKQMKQNIFCVKQSNLRRTENAKAKILNNSKCFCTLNFISKF